VNKGGTRSFAAGLIILGLLLAQLLINTVGLIRDGDSVRPLAPGDLAPSFVLETPDGKKVRLHDLRGSPVVINFWASWCRHCMRKMPFFAALERELGPQGVKVLAINVEKTPGLVKDILQKNRDIPSVLIGDEETINRYRVQTLPQSLIVDPHGYITLNQVGIGDQEDFKRVLQQTLKIRFNQ
jgi:thiol-disulfide isomerase/thioredoxin